MAVKNEQIEKNLVKLTFEVSAEDFDKAINQVYKKNVKKFNVPGYRKGKAPRKIIEKYYTEAVFYDEAINSVLPQAYDEALKESGVESVARPEIDVEEIKKGEPVVFTALVTTKPEVKLGDYKGIEVEKIDHTVTDEDVEKYYNENIDKYKKKAGANAKHILFESEDEALAAKAKIDSGETTFDALFEQYKGNASGTFPKAEDLGYVENDKENFDTDFLAGFKQLKEGEISAPVKSSFGYHIIKVEGVQAEDTTTPLDEVKDSIKSTLETDKKKEVYNSTLEQWKKDLKVKTYENRL